MRYLTTILTGLTVMTAIHSGSVLANDKAVIGGLLGGAFGAAVGNHINGRNGAIVGAALGGATGVAIATDSQHNNQRHYDRTRPRYEERTIETREEIRYREEPRYETRRVIIREEPRVYYRNIQPQRIEYYRPIERHYWHGENRSRHHWDNYPRHERGHEHHGRKKRWDYD